MSIRLSIVVLLSSIVCDVYGASVAVNVTNAVNVTDAEMMHQNTSVLNSTAALNASENILNARQIDLLLNVSETIRNSTGNATHTNISWSIETRDSGKMLVLDSSITSNSSNSSGLETPHMGLNSTVAHSSKVDNFTDRAASVDDADISPNSTTNGTANPWSSLPLFRDLNAALRNSTLRNSSDSSNSSQITHNVESPDNSIETEVDEELSNDRASNQTDQLLEDSNDESLEDGSEDDEIASTKKPCATISCLVSRGCSDSSCLENN